MDADKILMLSSCQHWSAEGDEHSCETCQVRNLFVFKELNPGELKVLNSERMTILYQAGESIYKEGTKPSGLLCLSKGKVKIEKEKLSGESQIVALKKESEFIGFADLISQATHSSSAIALEDCRVCYIPKENFLKVLHSNHTLALKIIEYLANELLRTNGRMADLTQKHMRARLADAILYAYEKFRFDKDDRMIQVELKRSDLAALSNMTTANAIRTLTEFSRDQLISVDGRQISILNLSALRRISQMG